MRSDAAETTNGEQAMTATLPQSVLDAADVSAITQLVLRERDARDLGKWDVMRDCFQRDSLIRISWFRGNGADFVAGSIDMAKRGVLATHRLAPIGVTLAGDRALARLTAFIDIPMSAAGVEAMLSSLARFFYRVERRDGVWRLAGFDAIYRRDELTPRVPGQSIAIDASSLAGFRPSYRLLSWALAQQGYAIDGNLPGEDRPDLVAALTDELEGWAGIRH
jgi:hypothetical protein